MRQSVRDLVLVSLFAAVTAVSAQLRFTLPFTTVPFTMQVLAVLLAGLLLGPRRGALALALYVALGAVGVPVYSGFGAGLGVLLGPTGGYLWSYPFAAGLAGLLAHGGGRPTFLRLVLAALPALAVIYLGGAGWAVLVMGNPAMVVLAKWVAPFVVFDLVKVALAATVAEGVLRALDAMGYTQRAA